MWKTEICSYLELYMFPCTGVHRPWYFIWGMGRSPQPSRSTGEDSASKLWWLQFFLDHCVKESMSLHSYPLHLCCKWLYPHILHRWVHDLKIGWFAWVHSRNRTNAHTELMQGCCRHTVYDSVDLWTTELMAAILCVPSCLWFSRPSVQEVYSSAEYLKLCNTFQK